MKLEDPLDLVQAIVDRHPAVFSVLHEAVLLGWNSSQEALAALEPSPGPLRLRTRRSFENDYVVMYARQLLEPFELSGALTWVEEADTATLRLDPQYAVRVKKTDASGRTSNILTRRQKEIAMPGQLMLFGVSEGDLCAGDQLWLTVGYVPDALDERIETVGLTIGDGRFGLLVLDRADDATLAVLAPRSWEIISKLRRRIEG